MQKPVTFLFASLSLSFLIGCHTDAPQTPAPGPKVSTTPPPSSASSDPAHKDCDAISDPAQAEDCRLWKRVAEAKAKSKANNLVTHKPGSIQQP